MSTNKTCIVIGGANIDITGKPLDALVLKTSNPGTITITKGGVGRNIAENLKRLGVETKLITAVGDDVYGKKILDDAALIGLSMEHSLVVENGQTPVYMSILNEYGDMTCAVSYMDIINRLNKNFLQTKYNVIKQADLIVADANVPFETLDYITYTFNIPVIFDTVSTAKCIKTKPIINRFHTIKPNRLEAQSLTSSAIQNETDAKNAISCFIRGGNKKVFLTMGDKGIYYGSEKAFGHISYVHKNVVNATGAGDAFAAGLAYCHLINASIDYTASFAHCAAAMALCHKSAVNPSISAEGIISLMEASR